MATAGEEALGDGLYSGRESEAPGIVAILKCCFLGITDGSFVSAVPS